MTQSARMQTRARETSRRQLRVLTGLICLSLAIPLGALAQTSAPASAQAPLPPEAQDALKKGVIAAQQQDFLLAIRYFQDARKLAPDAPEIYKDLGLAESKIPGRELRAIAWFGAYLAAEPNAPNAAAVKEQIDVLGVKGRSNTSRLLKAVQDAVQKTSSDKDTFQSDKNYSAVVNLCAEVGDFAAALKTVDLIKSEFMKTPAQVAIAEAQIRAGDFADAKDTLQLARKTADSDKVDDLRRNEQLAIGRAQTDAEDLAGAQETLAAAQLGWKETQYSNIVGDQLYLAGAQARAGDVDSALNTLAVAQKQADLFSIRAAEEMAKAEVEIVAILEDAGQVAGAHKVADLIQDIAEDKYSIPLQKYDLVAVEVKAGDIVGAEKVASHIQDMDWRGRSQFEIVSAQMQAGDLVAAQVTANLIQDAHWGSNAQSILITAYAKAADFADALKSADLIQDMDWRSREWSEIAVAQVKAGDIVGAQRTVALIQNTSVRTWPLMTVAEAQANAGEIAGAQKTAALIQDASGHGQSYASSAIAEAQVKAGDRSGAQETLEHALKAADLIQDASGQSYEESEIAEAQVKTGDVAGAQESLSHALKAADLVQGASVRVAVLCQIARVKAKIGDITGSQSAFASALKAAYVIPKAELISGLSIFGDIAYAEAMAGDIPGALKTADLIQENFEKSGPQQRIAEIQLEAGDTAGAQKTLWSAERTASLIKSDYLKVNRWQDLLKAQGKINLANNRAANGGPVTVAQAPAPVQSVVSSPVHPAIPAIGASDWLSRLDDTATTDYCPLNTDPFLDLASYLKSLPPSDDPLKGVEVLSDAVNKIVQAQNVIDKMLKQQGAK